MAGDKLKAAFLGLTDAGKKSLAKSRDQRAQRAMADIAAARKQLSEVPNANPRKAILASEIELHEATIKATLKRPVGEAFKALPALGDQATVLRDRVGAVAVRVTGQDQSLHLLDMNLTAIRRAALLTPDEKAANTTRTALAVLEKKRLAVQPGLAADALKAVVDPLLTQTEALLKTAEQGMQTQAKPGTSRARSRAVLGDMADVPGLDEILDPAVADLRGRRNAAAEAAARLDVFDARFVNKGGDAAARVENGSMRTATVIRAGAMQQARTCNDPALAHRLGSLMVDEYAPDLGLSEATAALTKALVMDDPVEKLLTGKIRPEDAVQRIRDQADVGGVKPSDMLRMLRNQFEMRMGSLDMRTDVKAGESQPDILEKTLEDGSKSLVTPGFVLRDLEGEVDPAVLTGPDLFGAAGPKFQGGTLKYEGRGKDLIDALTQVVAAWDTDPVDVADALGARAPTFAGKGQVAQLPASSTGTPATTPAAITPAMLAAGAGALAPAADRTAVTALERAKDGSVKLVERELTATPYVAAPGLGQAHAVSGPLANGDDRAAQHGALDGREYAHLRMLHRADEEDRTTKVDYNGTQLTPEQVVRTYMATTYALDAGQVDRLLDSVTAAFATVPLTITFTAESMFGAKKDAPGYGTEYVSDVVYTRGQEDASSLVGRGENIGIAPSASPVAVKQAQIDALQEMIADRRDAEEPVEALTQALQKAQAQLAKLKKKKQPSGEEADAQVGTTGGTDGAWREERGASYQRWRADKDRREGRLDDGMLTGNAQTFGAVNASFDKMQGTSSDNAKELDGRNYYGNAHFLLKDAVRGRAAFCVRGASISIGGGKSSVQRTDLMMMLYDMIRGGNSNTKYIDAIALLAKGGSKAMITGTDWEIHIYGGFDMTKDASAIYLSSKVGEPVRGRIERFAKENGLAVATSLPDGKAVISQGAPVRLELASI